YMTLRQDPDLLTEFYLNNGGGPQNYVDAMTVQTGPKVMPFINGTLHWSYTDLSVLSIPAIDAGPSMDNEESAFRVWTGPGNPGWGHKSASAWQTWFFDISRKGGNMKIWRGFRGFPGIRFKRSRQ